MAEHLDDSKYAQRRYRDLRRDDIWKRLFARHPDIPDHEANRKAIYDYAFSLSDGATITFANLDEAATGHADLNRQDKHFATAKNAKQDEETLRKFCRDHRLKFNFAALNMLRNVYGGGFKPIVIDQALQSGRINFVRAGDDEIARWNEEDETKERSEILDEIIGARVITQQDRLRFQTMPLQQLRAEAARVRDERRLRQMTGQELRAYLRQQQAPTGETLPDDYTKDQLLLIIEANPQEFRDLCRRYGWKAIEERVGYTSPRIAGIVRTLKHEFDAVRV